MGSIGTGDAIAFLNSDSQLITPTHAANPGEVIAIWGTGLGAVNLDETMSVFTSTGGNQAVNVPLQVYIGGKLANIAFRPQRLLHLRRLDLHDGAGRRDRMRGLGDHADREHPSATRLRPLSRITAGRARLSIRRFP